MFNPLLSLVLAATLVCALPLHVKPLQWLTGEEETKNAKSVMRLL